jgi:microcystin-dependent protein
MPTQVSTPMLQPATQSLLVPPGAVMSFAMSAAPVGWLPCDGSVISRTTYAPLFSAVGTTFGAGDSSTTFRVPDLRGEFIRGWAAGGVVDTGRVFGSSQTDELKSHTHPYTWTTGEAPAGTYGVGGSGLTRVTNFGTTSPTGGTETRPRNIALLYCIKF